MKVHEIMTAHARCAGPDNTLVEAAGLMRELDVGALPVCEEDRIAGMITDRDIAVRAVADGRDPNQTTVRDVMTPGVAFVMADQDVEDAARLMQEREIRRLPVLNREKRLVGIVSLGDIAMSSNPAFSGITLREISEPDNPNGRQRRRDALGRAAGAGPAMERERESEGQERGRREDERRRGGDEERETETPTPRRRTGSSARASAGAGQGATRGRSQSGGGRQQRQRKAGATRKRESAAKQRGGKARARAKR